MSTEHNNTALEFETMLRRHLKNGGAPVSTCVGFDADSASSYLEGALIGPGLKRYETHLAGCPQCRKHLIEVSKLMQLTTQNGVFTPNPSASISDRWLRFKSAINNSFALDWRWNWRVAGIAGAAVAVCGVLFSVMMVQPWRQSSPAHSAIIAYAPVPLSSEASPTPDQSTTVSAATIPEDVVINDKITSDKERQSVPAPKLQPTPGAGSVDEMLAKTPAGEMKKQSGGNEAFATLMQSTAPGRVDSARPAPQQVSQLNAVIPPSRQESDIVLIAEAKERSRSAGDPEIAPRIAPSPDDNPMRPISSIEVSARRANGRSQSDKAAPRADRPAWYDRVMGFMPAQKAERENKSPASIRPVKDDETVSPLTRKLRDKTFRFDRGIWVDQSYKPETMQWRMKRLTRGSREYEQLLSQEPLLREFFSMSPIIIVWGDKVYRVIGQ